jgi:hypothetical protein
MMGETAVRVVRNQLVLSPGWVDFQRTLPIPESGLHPRPPGLGRFRLRQVEAPVVTLKVPSGAPVSDGEW